MNANVGISVYFTKVEYQKIESVAKAAHRSMSSWIRLKTLEALKA